jgi:SOS-response transcriptional repressor LexA
MGLTARQLALLDYIRGYMAERRIAPTCEEMRIAMGLASRSTVHRMLDALHQRGAVRRVGRRARALQVLSPATGTDLQPLAEPASRPPPLSPIPRLDLEGMESRALMGLRSDIDCELKRRREESWLREVAGA